MSMAQVNMNIKISVEICIFQHAGAPANFDGNNKESRNRNLAF